MVRERIDRSKVTHFDPELVKELEQRKATLCYEDYLRLIYSQVNIYGAMHALCKQLEQPVQVFEQFGNYVRLQVEATDMSVGRIFGLVESIKAEYNVCEYSVSQTTLEQIFQSFAQQGEEEQVEMRTFAVQEGTLK